MWPKAKVKGQKAKVKRQKSKAVAAPLVLFAFFLFPFALAWAQSPAPSPDLPPGPLQQKARTACLECHDAHIIVQQRLDRKTWTREVDKMIRWGAVVDAADRQAFIDYFSAGFSPEKPVAAPPAPNSRPARLPR